MKKTLLTAAALALALPAHAQDEPEGAPSPNQIVEAADAEEWVSISPEDLLVMTLAPDPQGNPRQVVIQLMPAPFSQGWVENIRKLARAKWYDDISVNRVQDNYVVQWGDPNYDNPEAEGETKTLPEGLRVMGEDEYSQSMESMSSAVQANKVNLKRDEFGRYLPLYEERERRAMISIASTRTSSAPQGWHQRDSYGYFVEFYNGWPIASNTAGDSAVFWPVHCYGMVGVGRNYSPDTGSGAELYTVIGHAPRHLDRNIALVGRIIEGMEHLSSLPRGKGELGFYGEDELDKRTPILSVRVVSDLQASSSEAAGRKYAFEYLSTESETFAKYAEARANRRDPFFIHPAGGADICNIPVPVRRVASD
ncbi:peptidylprolyl isomerase [Altererythrobacter xiamenensis]|uniref:peptidylprolyl isomerase n=1 Tax=Altererythrobacter xiamenensis TaxID=1316679 RepID=A0A1Y6F4K4_9SPHN|nr:peptidylprolyl isomerase [Altererythrobacter xiamenensis]SMQ69825.1 peptidylprolyl isomerase [Altererythrobacter xiamenensis]